MHQDNCGSLPGGPASPQVLAQHRQWLNLASIVLSGLSLCACSPSVPAPVNPSLPDSIPRTPMNSIYGPPVRVIVKFRQTVPYREAAFLQGISQQIHARLAYISSVSLDTHVYQIEPQLGQDQSDTLQSLSAIPSVLWVEADALVRPY